MNRKLKIYGVILVTGMLIAIIYHTNLSTTEVEAKTITQSNQMVNELRGISVSYQNKINSSLSSTSIYLPSVVYNWIPPCGTIPLLIEPLDGSIVSLDTIIKFDGRGKDLYNDWVGVYYSENKDFSGEVYAIAYQPANSYSMTLDEFDQYNVLTPEKWYWRADLWCNGPGFPPPPEGYKNSPFTEVWSFTLK